MADIVSLDEVRKGRRQQDEGSVADELANLADAATDGQIKGFCYVAITAEGERTLTGYVKGNGCGMHELVGAAALLQDFLIRNSADE